MTSKKTMLSLGLIFTLLAGCSEGPKMEPDTPTTLKVMFYSEGGFYQQYGLPFSALHPEIQVEIVSTQGVQNGEDETYDEAILKLIEEKRPDVLVLNVAQYKQLSHEGRLLDLETRAAKDGFDLSGISPGILEYIRGLSDGKLQGLSPGYFTQALFYNKDLFQKYGVPFPEDRMSWESLLQLAARFPTDGEPDERVYGLKPAFVSDLNGLAGKIGGAMGLSYFSGSDMKMTANSESWKKVVEMADQALKSGSLYTGSNSVSFETYEEYLLQDAFISGKAAMTIDSTYLISQIEEAQSVVKEKVVQNWDVVTVPVDPNNPGYTDLASVNEILAIDAQSPNIEAAWKFLRYVNGDDYARVTSKADLGLSSRPKYFSDEEGHNLQAFYALTPREETVYKDYGKLPNESFSQLLSLIMAEMSEAEQGEKTVSEALEDIQNKGQLILDGKGGPPSETGGSGLMIAPRS
ncbi:ABC transporter substrate-binding protein [Cohnella hongkongensis]|uniref:ABC transporter substrate-binding protein n=1 Tax=Cohnella hongkongensis TaxID=178337 RepID=A0ABV9F6K2_9BACL